MKTIVNIEQLKSVDLGDIAQSLGVDLRKRGSSYSMRCPYHFEGRQIDQHIGNCYISKDRKFFECKSCGNKGDAITLIRQVLDCSFPEALNYLSDYSGIPLQYVEEGSMADENGIDYSNFKKRLTNEELRFLDISTGGMYITKSIESDITDDDKIESVTNKKGETLYFLIKEYNSPNFINELCISNYSVYCSLIKYFINKKYAKLKDKYDKWKNSLYESRMERFINEDIHKLKELYEKVGGDPSSIKPLRNEFQFNLDIGINPF